MRKWLLAGILATALSGLAAAWWDGRHIQITHIARKSLEALYL